MKKTQNGITRIRFVTIFYFGSNYFWNFAINPLSNKNWIRLDFDEVIPDTPNPPDDSEIKNTSLDMDCDEEVVPIKMRKISPMIPEIYADIVNQYVQRSQSLFSQDIFDETAENIAENVGENVDEKNGVQEQVEPINQNEVAEKAFGAVVKDIGDEKANADLQPGNIRNGDMLASSPNDVQTSKLNDVAISNDLSQSSPNEVPTSSKNSSQISNQNDDSNEQNAQVSSQNNVPTSRPIDVPPNQFNFTLDHESEKIDIKEIIDALMSQEDVTLETEELIEMHSTIQDRVNNLLDEAQATL